MKAKKLASILDRYFNNIDRNINDTKATVERILTDYASNIAKEQRQIAMKHLYENSNITERQRNLVLLAPEPKL